MATPGKGIFSNRTLLVFGVTYAWIMYGSHVEACRERARQLRYDLARLDYDCEKYGWEKDRDFPVFYWYGVRYLKVEEARLELARLERRASTLRRFSLAHRVYDLIPEFE